MMPLEMFRGSRGRVVLIARLPVHPDSYAEIETFRSVRIEVFHPIGLVINKHPALTPRLESLSERLRRSIDEARRRRLRNLRKSYEEQTGRPMTAGELAALQAEINRPVHVNGVGVNQPLLLKLPKAMGGEYDLGTIRTIIIHNQGKRPVTVSS